jgi:hypothetical protein
MDWLKINEDEVVLNSVDILDIDWLIMNDEVGSLSNVDILEDS